MISSDRPPREMNILQGRIRSRFEWGLLAEIGVLEYETRMAILSGKEQKRWEQYKHEAVKRSDFLNR